MTNKGMRKIIYLMNSHKPWAPHKLAIEPWEVGLLPSGYVDLVVKETTWDIDILLECNGSNKPTYID